MRSMPMAGPCGASNVEYFHASMMVGWFFLAQLAIAITGSRSMRPRFKT